MRKLGTETLKRPAQGHTASVAGLRFKPRESGSCACLPDYQAMVYRFLFVFVSHIQLLCFQIWPFHFSHTHTKLDLYVYRDLQAPDFPKASGSWQHCRTHDSVIPSFSWHAHLLIPAHSHYKFGSSLSWVPGHAAMPERLLANPIIFDLGPQCHSHKLPQELTFSTVLKLQASSLI